MQTFKCHYRRVKWPTRRYFAHVKEVLIAAGSTLGEIHHCTPPPCKTPGAAPFTPGTYAYAQAGPGGPDFFLQNGFKRDI